MVHFGKPAVSLARGQDIPTESTEVGLDLAPAQQEAAGTLLCRDGCAAVLDSGTSLIAAPSYALQGLAFIVPQVHENCSNFEEMPTLELHLGGRRVLLPPEAYIFRLTGTLAEARSVWDILHFKPKVGKGRLQCSLGRSR